MGALWKGTTTNINETIVKVKKTMGSDRLQETGTGSMTAYTGFMERLDTHFWCPAQEVL
jgi:hypothetical protein